MLLQVNGHRLYVEQYGRAGAPVVVLLHHGLGSVRAWRGQTQAFSAAGFWVVAYDRWGYGQSEPRPGLDLPDFATDIHHLNCILDQLQVRQAALVGHSDGGTIALTYAALQPERVSCIVTIAAHIYVEPKMEPAIEAIDRAFRLDEHFRRGMKLAHGEKYESVLRNWFDGWHREEALSWDMRPLLTKIRCRALVVQGAEDEHATPQHAEDIAAAIAGSELWLLPGAKHMLPQENESEFNQKVIRFLKDQMQKNQWMH